MCLTSQDMHRRQTPCVAFSSHSITSLTSSKWAAIAKYSQDTALRDIGELLEREILKRSEASGCSTSYELVMCAL
jgi:predicted HTH transcriptional regulator